MKILYEILSGTTSGCQHFLHDAEGNTQFEAGEDGYLDKAQLIAALQASDFSVFDDGDYIRIMEVKVADEVEDIRRYSDEDAIERIERAARSTGSIGHRASERAWNNLFHYYRRSSSEAFERGLRRYSDNDASVDYFMERMRERANKAATAHLGV